MEGATKKTGLAQLAAQLRQEIPSLNVTAQRGRLSIGSKSGAATIKKAGIGVFSAQERSEKRASETSYVDLNVGEVYVAEPGLILLIRLRSPAQAITPLICVVLAAILEEDEFDWLARSLALPPGEWRDQLAARCGVRLSASNVTKVRKALTSDDLVRQGVPSPLAALETILSNFRLDSIGKSIRLAAPMGADAAWLKKRTQGESRIIEGVAGMLAAETGAVIEPADFLTDRSTMQELESSLGGSVEPGFRGPSVIVRGVSRVPLGLVDPAYGQRILTLLAVSDALGSEDPIKRELATRLANDWKKQWK